MRRLPLLATVLVIGGVVAYLFWPVQGVQRLLDDCSRDPRLCVTVDSELCAAGAEGAAALTAHVPDPATAPEPLRALVYGHARCAGEHAPAIERIVATLTDAPGDGPQPPALATRRQLVGGLPAPLRYRVYAQAHAAGVPVPLPLAPHPDELAASQAVWCAEVLPILGAEIARSAADQKASSDGPAAMSRLFEVDCGPGLDAALTAATTAAEAPRVAGEAALQRTHGGANRAFDIATREAGLAYDRANAPSIGYLLVAAEQHIKAHGSPWRFLKPIVTAPLSCTGAGTALFRADAFLALPGWTPADRAALAAVLAGLTTRCPWQITSLRLDSLYRALPAHGEAIVKALADSRPHCDWAARIEGHLTGQARPAPDAATRAAIAAYRADVAQRCPPEP